MRGRNHPLRSRAQRAGCGAISARFGFVRKHFGNRSRQTFTERWPMRSKLFLAPLLIIVMAALLTSQAFAQAAINYAQLNGTVSDPVARAGPNASVSLRNLDTNQVYSAT